MKNTFEPPFPRALTYQVGPIRVPIIRGQWSDLISLQYRRIGKHPDGALPSLASSRPPLFGLHLDREPGQVRSHRLARSQSSILLLSLPPVSCMKAY